jgi:hypothetical protein
MTEKTELERRLCCIRRGIVTDANAVLRLRKGASCSLQEGNRGRQTRVTRCRLESSLHFVGRGQRHAFKGKLSLVFIEHVLDHEVLFAVRSKGCQGVAKR